MSCGVVSQGVYCGPAVASPRVSAQLRRNNNVFTRGSGLIGTFDFPACELRRSAGRSDIPVIKASSDNSAGVETVDVEQVQIGVVEEFLSGEWPENFSILNFEDLSAHLEPAIFKAEAQPSTFLADVMSKIIYTASPEQLLEDIDHHFENVSGFPVINEELKCIGVMSKKDRAKASKGLKSKVCEVMSSPVITLSADKTVLDAAVLMLKNKIHRIPIVNETDQVIGIVTRTDIFHALEEFSM